MSRLDSALSLFAVAAVLTTTLAGCRDASIPTRLLTPRSPSRTEVATAPVVNSLADNGSGCSDSQCTLRGNWASRLLNSFVECSRDADRHSPASDS